MKARQEVFDTYWRFGAERHRIFEQRVAGLPEPWTTDPVLQRFKFCNTFRAADRVSQYMIRQLYANPSTPKADLVFQATVLRTFSKTATWDRLTALLGQQPTVADLQDGGFATALDAIHAEGNGLYTAAFILPSGTSTYGHERKHRNHAALFHDEFIVNESGDRIAAAGSLQEVFELLLQFPMMGDFLAYQTAIDVNYTTAVNFSENDFTKPGPGAVRGLKKVFTDLDCSLDDAIQWMVRHQDEQFERLGLEFKGLWGRKLHAIDCQGLFCETDKYSRVAFPELESGRVRIKAKFSPSREGLPLFFPPKWGINDKLPKPKPKLEEEWT